MDYYYDDPSGEIKCREDQYIQNLVDENRWENDTQQKQVNIDFSLSKWVIDIENLPTGNQYGDNGTVKTASPSTDGSSTHPTSDSSRTPGGISTLTEESDRDKLSSLLQNTSDKVIADILKRLTKPPSVSEPGETEDIPGSQE